MGHVEDATFGGVLVDGEESLENPGIKNDAIFGVAMFFPAETVVKLRRIKEVGQVSETSVQSG